MIKKLKKPRPVKKTKFELARTKRNYKNRHLYNEDMIEGYDYVVCPVSNDRMNMIKSNYITGCLELSVEQFNNKYPNCQKICNKRFENIKQGLKKIDEETGLTKHQISIIASRKTLSEIDKTTGLTKDKMRTNKTVNTHRTSIDEKGMNGFERLVYLRQNTILQDGRKLEEHAHEKRKQTILQQGFDTSRKASKLSKIALAPVLKLLEENQLKYYFDKNEYAVNAKNISKMIYMYDLVCPEIKLVVEYQSSRYHPWLTMTTEEWKNWQEPFKKYSADEKRQMDVEKAKTIWELRGFFTWEVFQKTEKIDVEELLCFIKTLTMKY